MGITQPPSKFTSGNKISHMAPQSAVPTSGANSSESDSPPGTLEIRNASKAFPNVQVLTDMSLDVRPGEILTLLGENGMKFLHHRDGRWGTNLRKNCQLELRAHRAL